MSRRASTSRRSRRCFSQMLYRTLLLVSVLAGAGCTRDDAVVVGSKNFTEQRVLGELLAQTIERAGMHADRRLDLGGTFVCDSALRAGQIDVYVEYSGTALGAILKQAPDQNPASVMATVKAAYAKDSLVWSKPLGFDNSFALIVRGDVPATTISEAATLARTWKAGFGYEFKERADGYPALVRTYDLTFADIATMDLGLLYRALGDKQVDVIVGSATDGPIARLGLKVLDDDRHAFPPYEAAAVVRRQALDRHPGLAQALDSLSGRLDVATMRRLNEAVDGEHRSPADVAAEFLNR